jgi:hypothetical protein
VLPKAIPGMLGRAARPFVTEFPRFLAVRWVV